MTGYLVTLGETMARITSETLGPISAASTASFGIGGSESNVAIAIRRLGTPSVWFGRVGQDALGGLVEQEIRSQAVDVRATIDPDAPTGLLVKERRTSAIQRVSYYRTHSAGSRLSPADIDEHVIKESALLHLTGITPALSLSALLTVRAAIDIAKAASVPISLDLNYRSKLWSASDAARVYTELIPNAHVVFGGADEAQIATGHQGSPAELASALRALGADSAVIKLGSDGAIAQAEGITVRIPAVQVSPVDTVGAGDAFVAGYLSELMRGSKLDVQMNTAVICGAFACLSLGDWEGSPRRDELNLLTKSEPVER